MKARPAKRKNRALKPASKKKQDRIVLQVETFRRNRYSKAADAAETTLSDWMRQTLDAACRQAGID